MTPLRLAVATALCASPLLATAAQPSQEELLRMLEKLSERVESLEKQNAALAARLQDTPEASSPPLAARVEALETAQATRSAAGNFLTGIEVEGNVVGVLQSAAGPDHDETHTNWRGDVGITLPAGQVGDAVGSFFVQLRAGQGEGPSELPTTFTGTLNTASFQQADVNAANANAIIAQAFYQLDTPLGGADSGRNLAVTVGKQDPFVFFDQNAVADNEVEKFMNNVFVHNPLLDSGGAIGADEYGFSPGLRVAYSQEGDASGWGISGAVYGAGDGSTFGRSFTQPFYIAQLEYGPRGDGREGSYRVYAWHNGQYEGFDGSTGKNTGIGLSFDQQVNDLLTLFGRYGHNISGKVSFDRALTLGGEFNGSAWGRDDDGIGFAWGWLRSSRAFRRAAVGLTDYGYEASGAEQVAELYYRYAVNEQLSLSPDLQFVHRPGANGDEDSIYAFGVRALYGF